MKIYEKDYHCFGCGAHGDIFSFVMKMDGLTFQDAFKELGGTYEREQKGHTGYKGRLSIYHAQKKREQALKEQERLAKKISLNNLLITIYRRHKEKAAPMSDAWCSSCNALERQLYIHEVLSESR
jgi:DNA primase